MSTLSTIQGFFQRKEEPVSKQEKKEIVLALQGKSRRDCEKELSALDPQAALPQEKERVVSPTQTEIRFIADDALMQKLQKIREFDGHVQINPSYLELFHRMADITLKKLDPSKRKTASKETRPAPHPEPAPFLHETSGLDRHVSAPPAERSQSETVTTPPAESVQVQTQPQPQPAQSEPIQLKPDQSTSRYIPAALKREIWRRDQGRCTYHSPDGQRCSSRFALEVDHVQPMALGGETKLENLRLLCRAHNIQQAVAKLGPGQMQAYVR